MEVIPQPGQTWKNKKTGETVLISDINYNGEVCVIDENGLEKSLKNFSRNYVKLEFDVEKYIQHIPEFKHLFNSYFYEKLAIIARRLHPGGYFKKGCLVFITDPRLLKVVDVDNLFRRPYRIVDITPDNTIPLLSKITLKALWYEGEILVPMYADRVCDLDAYSCLKRYDLPY